MAAILFDYRRLAGTASWLPEAAGEPAQDECPVDAPPGRSAAPLQAELSEAGFTRSWEVSVYLYSLEHQKLMV
jgi:hypothetical protein